MYLNHKTKYRAVLLSALFSVSPLLIAAEPGKAIESALQTCLKTNSSTLGMQACYQTAQHSWDNELNQQYKALLLEQPASVKQALKQSQRDWITYSDTYFHAIDLFYQKEQGTIWGLVAIQRKIAVIQQKALDLYQLRVSTDLSAPAS